MRIFTSVKCGLVFASHSIKHRISVVAIRSLRFCACSGELHALFYYRSYRYEKLKTWQKVLLVIFYPVGIVYFIVWLCNRNKSGAGAVGSSKLSVIRDFNTKVVGVTFSNDDGSSRQEIIKTAKRERILFLSPYLRQTIPTLSAFLINAVSNSGTLTPSLPLK